MFACQNCASSPDAPLNARNSCRAFHARIQSLSSGSPRSEGTPPVKCQASGHVAMSVSATYQTAALSAVSGRSLARRDAGSGGTEETRRERRDIVVDAAQLLRRGEEDEAEGTVA